ncbi:MAG: NAD(P)-dependent oxidoreductase [Rubrimonas sp.]|uniref:SDR family oxidoreductase n=1 Tax=Rubrimonas sp. TaxID=2036015 RepID=UPI002FDE22FA
MTVDAAPGPLAGRTIVLSGGSRGIGLAIACACAAGGANVAILAKTAAPHPKLPGTIHSAAAEIEASGRAHGARALPVLCDIRDADAVTEAVAQVAEAFGRIDAVVNNASAISLTPTAETDVKRFDLMTGVNSRGSFVVTRACLPHLMQAEAPHILTISPPLDLRPRWFGGHPAYSLAKYGMSLLALGWAAEFTGRIASNCLWPRTTIDTAAVRNLLGGAELAARSRIPAIMGDAAAAILARPVSFSGWFLLDDLVLAAEGVRDFDAYAVEPGGLLAPDFFVPADAPSPDEAEGMQGWRAPRL